jgi:hypothetical protein
MQAKSFARGKSFLTFCERGGDAPRGWQSSLHVMAGRVPAIPIHLRGASLSEITGTSPVMTSV